jgi:hypothetical protein
MKKKDSSISSDGGPIFLGKVDNRRGVIRGRSDQYQSGISADEASKLFESLFARIDQHSRLSKDDKADLKVEVQEVREELEKNEDANESFILRRLRNIGRMTPEILEVTLATITNPVAGFGMIASKIAAKAKAGAS